MKQHLSLLFLTSVLLTACGSPGASIDPSGDDASDELVAGSPVASESVSVGREQAGFASAVLKMQSCKLGSSKDCWGSYQDFVVDSAGNFSAVFTVPLNANAVAANVTGLTLNTVTRSSQGVKWTFALFNNASQAYDVVGDTSAFADWRWTAGKFNASGVAKNYVNAQRSVLVRLSVSSAKNEDILVDALSVVAQSDAQGNGSTTGNGNTTTSGNGNSTMTGGESGTSSGGTTGTTGTSMGGGSGTTTGNGGTSAGGSGTTTGTSGTTTGTSNGGACWWSPSPSQSWLWDLDNSSVPVPAVNGAKVTNYSADVYDVDMFNSTAAQIATYHNAGKKVVCYVDVGSMEPGRPDVSNFDSSCYCGVGVAAKADGSCSGNTHKMDGWNEWWFNLAGTCGTSVINGLTPRIQMAAQKGCDAIEIDNIDAYSNSTGWTITQGDEYAFVMGLAKVAHANCLGIIYKNAGDMLQNSQYGASLVSTFDGSLNEQCQQYSECSLYSGFVAAKKAAWNAEYTKLSCGAPAGMKTIGYDSTLAVEYKRLNLVCP